MSRRNTSSAAGKNSTPGETLDGCAPAHDGFCSVQVPAELASLTLVEKFTESLCMEIALGSERTDAIVLSVSEALSNALRHGIPVDVTAECIQLHYTRDERALKVCITDPGRELPHSVLTRYREHIVDMPLTGGLAEMLPEGGWGINLILQGTSEVSYRRVSGLNHLTLCFALKA